MAHSTVKSPGQTHFNPRAQKRPTRKKAFAREICRQCENHGDKPGLTLLQKIAGPGTRYSPKLLQIWADGKFAPRNPSSFELLRNLEQRYGLEKDHFRSILHPLTPTERAVRSVIGCQENIVRRHLPKRFDFLSVSRQNEIIAWLKRNVLQGATEYGARLRGVSSNRYALHFPSILEATAQLNEAIGPGSLLGNEACRRLAGTKLTQMDIPERLINEFRDLVKFKCATIAPPGMLRTTGWGQFTAHQQIRNYCRIFGALVAPQASHAKGYGASRASLTLALFVFPAFWDWFLSWHEERRGFFTVHEKCTVLTAISHTREDTGWIRQSPQLAHNLRPIPGMIDGKDIRGALHNWDATCDKAVRYLTIRRRELERVVQIQRDSFEPIMAVLKSDKPLLEYRKIADEILRRFPNETLRPVDAAECARAYLLIRFGMQLGLRRRNLTELLVCPRGQIPKSETFLKKNRRGEMRWLDSAKAWEIYIPAVAFKNWNSHFFRRSPFRVVLSDVADLYKWIEKYLLHYRPKLLNGHVDPNTFFIRTMREKKSTAEFSGNALTSLWRSTIIRFGIYNPYTRRGAVKGLLPHGPHSIRDVIATHLVKQTSSFELAAYALHSTPKMIERHYCRFLAEEKFAVASKALNKIWEGHPAAIRKPRDANRTADARR